MASYDGGYDCEFVEKPPEILQSECPVCLQIIREPYQADCCGYAFCRVCIEQVKADNKPCPCCKTEKFDKFEDKRLIRTLYVFKVYCTNKKQGCKWTGELRQLNNHVNSNPSQEKQLAGCQFIEVKCIYCSELVKRLSIQVHQEEQCLRRPFSCEYCNNFDSNYEDVATNHWPECGYYPVQCTNSCGKITERQHLKVHISDDCPLTVIDCEFSHVGCEEKFPRKNILTHLTESIVKHLSLQGAYYKTVINRLEEENKQLKEQVAKLTQDLKLQQIYTPICPVEFTMTNFEQHKLDDNEWLSPPFYTHPKGYKMCMYVTANSYGVYDGTHTAVGVYLKKGEFDDRLTWPFRGVITIQLFSQEDEEYKETTLSYTGTETDYDEIASRVMIEDRNVVDKGPATLDFISHTDLIPKYLKNDCIKLRVNYVCR